MAGIMLVNPSVLTLRKEAKYLLPVLRSVLPAYPGITGDIAKPGVGRARLQPATGQGHVLAVPRLAGRPARTCHKVTVAVLLLHSRVDHTVEPINAADRPRRGFVHRHHRHRAGAQLSRRHAGLRRRVDLHLVGRVHREGHRGPAVTTAPGEGEDFSNQDEQPGPAWRSHPSDADVDAAFAHIISGLMVEGGPGRHPSAGGSRRGPGRPAGTAPSARTRRDRR